MGIDEAGTLASLKALRHDLIGPNIATHSGRIVKLMGDGMLVEFGSASTRLPVRSRSRNAFASMMPADPKLMRSSSTSASMSATSSSKATIFLAMASTSLH
jgi:class 3 adenylate cyclase